MKVKAKAGGQGMLQLQQAVQELSALVAQQAEVAAAQQAKAVAEKVRAHMWLA